MSIFDNTQPFQMVVVAPGRSIVRNGYRYLASQVLTLPTAEAEALALAGFIVIPEQARVIELSPEAQEALGVLTVDDAILKLLALIGGAAEPALLLPSGGAFLLPSGGQFLLPA
ncbi:MAG: hypothetical protein ACYDD1_20030 [Caulobacteraceae bacterium]